MAKTVDDLEAVRTVTTTLSGFSPEEQERIMRWAREKLGLAHTPLVSESAERLPQPSSPPAAAPSPGTTPATDLKTFVTAKRPKSDQQFAATVAYFYRFEAPPEQRRSEIDANVLQDACRLAGRKRLKNALMTLNNAKNQGLLDSGSERGRFAINTVGENLVAMALPAQADTLSKSSKPKNQIKRSTSPAKKKRQSHE
jgi:hypothetical protein